MIALASPARGRATLAGILAVLLIGAVATPALAQRSTIRSQPTTADEYRDAYPNPDDPNRSSARGETVLEPYGLGPDDYGFLLVGHIGGGFYSWAEGGIETFGGGIGLFARGEIWPIYSRHAGFAAYAEGFVGIIPIPLIFYWGTTHGAAAEIGGEGHLGIDVFQVFGRIGLGARGGGIVGHWVFDNGSDPSTDESDSHSYLRVVAGMHIWASDYERFDFYALFDQPRIGNILDDVSYGAGGAYHAPGDFEIRFEIFWNYARTNQSRGAVFRISVTKIFGEGYAA